MTAVIELLHEIQDFDVRYKILGESPETHDLQANRYNRLSSLLEATADGLDGPEARDTF
jgi:hypothetical protein